MVLGGWYCSLGIDSTHNFCWISPLMPLTTQSNFGLGVGHCSRRVPTVHTASCSMFGYYFQHWQRPHNLVAASTSLTRFQRCDKMFLLFVVLKIISLFSQKVWPFLFCCKVCVKLSLTISLVKGVWQGNSVGKRSRILYSLNPRPLQ